MQASKKEKSSQYINIFEIIDTRNYFKISFLFKNFEKKKSLCILYKK